jgi:beta-phosphoglucomutase-like phosphatase (HAD superfamily)
MIKPLAYYLREGLVRKSKPNLPMAKSLVNKALIRLNRIQRETILEEESSIVFEDIYESLREASQALMEVQGYKPYSHEATVSFMKENKLLTAGDINIVKKMLDKK